MMASSSVPASHASAPLFLPLLLLLLPLMIMGMMHESVYGTHTSIPVIEPMDRYIAGRSYSISGLVLYNGQPTSDVLVEVRIDAPYGSSSEHVMSLEDGRFTISFNPMEQGYYTITATSNCRDVHRSICTYQSTVLEVAVYDEITIERLCTTDGECIDLHRGIVLSYIDAIPEPEPLLLDTVRGSLMIRLGDVGERAHATLTMPSDVIDVPEFLLADGMTVEQRSDTSARVVELPVIDHDGDGRAVLEIIGVHVIPEFPVAMLILAASMLALLTVHRSWLIKHMSEA